MRRCLSRTSAPRWRSCSRCSIAYRTGDRAHQPRKPREGREGAAKPELVEGGTRLFLVKVINEAALRAPLTVQSPNSGRVYVRSRNSPRPRWS